MALSALDATNEALTNIAAAVALIAIDKGDHEKRSVTLTFKAQRDASGVLIETIALEWKAIKP